MRRTFSISLIVLLWLGPLAAVLPGLNESRLPFCCRRHGVHHCAMDGDAQAAQSGEAGAAFSAPSRCPQFPALPAATTGRAFLATASATIDQGLTVDVYAPGAIRAAARAGLLRTRSDRGPPAMSMA